MFRHCLSSRPLYSLCLAAGTAFSVVISVERVEAAQILLDETLYDVSTKPLPSPVDFFSVLEDQPWFGDAAAAESAALQIADSSLAADQISLLYTFDSAVGQLPLVFTQGFEISPGLIEPFQISTEVLESPGFIEDYGQQQFAVATPTDEALPIPEPLTILGSLTALGIGVAAKVKQSSLSTKSF